MSKIDDLIDELLGMIEERGIREGATFSTRVFTDQPLIESGRSMQRRLDSHDDARQERIASREQERAARRNAARAARQTGLRTATQEPTQAEQGRPQSEPWSGRLFSIAPKPTAPTLRRDALPARIKEMRRLEKRSLPREGLRLAYASRTSSQLFFEQAKLMEDYEDSYEFTGPTFTQYYPSYAVLSDHQLRGYFSWRTKLRAGTIEDAPHAFAFMYAYELLMGIGTVPGARGLADLRQLLEGWSAVARDGGWQLREHLPRWISDYAVYHNLTDELRPTPRLEMGASVLVLLRSEHARLAAAGLTPKIACPEAAGPAPTTAELYQALGETASYHLCDSRLGKREPQLVAAIASDVFGALVLHCAKRRKTDFVEGLFGYAVNYPYTMYSAAVFFEPEPHADCEVVVAPHERYRCQGGHWRHWLACETTARSKDLGIVLHAIDYELRQQLDYPYPLKAKKTPKYVQKMVHDAVAARLAERAEAERRRITIDRSKLGGIRAAAAVTQEALLTDEERDELPTVAAPAAAVAPIASHPAAAAEPAQPTIPQSFAGPQPDTSSGSPDSPLTPLEARFLQGLLDGLPASVLLGPTDPFVSVVADTINEKFFDLVGDAVIEFDGEAPLLIDDYLDDIREVLHA